MKEPKFWYAPTQISSIKTPFLWILSLIFRLGAAIKEKLTLTRSVDQPVICIGNLTVGGAGKTPVTLSIAQYFKSYGKKVAIISRGYKGKLKGPLLVNPKQHTAQDVGDEPLLLSLTCPTWIAANRYKGAKAALEKGAEIILLDDGLQNSTLKQDLKICVVDAKRGFGNKKVIPAGPLREPIKSGLDPIDVIILTGNPHTQGYSFKNIKKPVLHATISANRADCSVLKNKVLIAFAGLAAPQKFFETLRLEGFDLKRTFSFPDHHFYTARDLEKLQRSATKYRADLVTTQKDWMRLPKDLQKKIHFLRIQLDYKDYSSFKILLDSFLKENEK